MRHAPTTLRHVGVWLHPRRLRRLAANLPADMLLVEARVELAERLPAFDALVVDPLVSDRVDVESVLRVCDEWRTVPTLVYTAMDAGVAAALLALGRAGVGRVAIERLDDGPAALRETFAVLGRESVARRGVALMSDAVGGLPPAVQAMVLGVLRLPAAMQSVDALAREAGMHRRALERWLHRDNLPCAADLLALARVASAYTHLCETDAPVADAAKLLGYATQRTLAEHAKVCAGMPLRDLRHRTPEEFVTAVRMAGPNQRWNQGAATVADGPASSFDRATSSRPPHAAARELVPRTGCTHE